MQDNNNNNTNTIENRKNNNVEYSLLRDLKTPKEWFSDEKGMEKLEEWNEYFNKFCLKYSINHKNIEILNALIDLSTSFTIKVYPNSNKKQFKFAWLGCYVTLLLDKHSDHSETPDESIKILKECQKLLYDSTNKETLKNFKQLFSTTIGAEKKTILLLIYKSIKLCENNNIKWLSEVVRCELAFWIDSLIPFDQINNCGMETILFLRYSNIGYDYFYSLFLLISCNNHFDPMIFQSSAIFKKIKLLASKQISLVNDMYSFEKEIRVNPNDSKNILNNHILNNRMTFDQAYHYLVDYINKLYLEINELTIQFLKDTKSDYNLSDSECIQLDFIIKNLFYLNGGNLTWSGSCNRYASENSKYLELKQYYQTNKLKFFKDKKFINRM